jgi:hypothetical protein
MAWSKHYEAIARITSFVLCFCALMGDHCAVLSKDFPKETFHEILRIDSNLSTFAFKKNIKKWMSNILPSVSRLTP